MIIRFPTGLYKTILPEGEESGNISYTISSNNPPSPQISVVQIPVAVELQESPSPVFNDEQRREQFGELVYTITNSNRTDPGSNVKLFEVGQILQFEENPPEEEIATLKSPDSLDIRHDTNLLDLESSGLTEDEIEQLLLNSRIKQKTLESQFLFLQTSIKDLDTQITENQKKINETNKTLNAVREVNDIPAGDTTYDEGVIGQIYQKLLLNLETLTNTRSNLIADRNSTATEAENTYQSIIKLSELIR